MSKAIEAEHMYGAHNYAPYPVVLVKGEGVYLWDENGKQYIDMMSAYSAVSHGHCHPKIVQALQNQASTLNVVSRAYFTDKLSAFLKRACELTGFEKALPMNSGAEAVETAIKAARKYAYTKKGVAADQAEIIVCAGNFHGRTTTIVGMSTEPQYRYGFGPFAPGFKTVPFGDVKALEAAITSNTAAFLVEPIQGEGGIIVPPAGYLKAVAELCQKHHILLICDEIQTGLGRTGKLLAINHEDVRPDAVLLGKALGGGILPVSLFLARAEVMDVFNPGDHGSTFGGNPLAATVGLTALNVLIEENLPERAEKIGQYFYQQLKALTSPVIKEVRGKGLLIGLEVQKGFSAYDICIKLLKHGIITKDTHSTVIRFAPPLIITEAQIDQAMQAIKEVLAEVEAEAKSPERKQA